MANKHRGEVEINLDQPRILRFTSNSIVKMERELGISVTKLDNDTMSYEVVRGMVWAGLLHEMKSLTPEQAGDLMDFGDFGDISEKAAEAYMLVFQKGSKQTGKK